MHWNNKAELVLLNIQGQVKKPRQRKARREGHDSLSQLSSDSLAASTSRRSRDDPAVTSSLKLPDLSATESKEMGMNVLLPPRFAHSLRHVLLRCMLEGLCLCFVLVPQHTHHHHHHHHPSRQACRNV